MKHPLRRRWMYVGFLGLRTLARWLPLSVAQAIGRVLGLGAYALLGRYRTMTLENLRYALGPSVSDYTCQYIARGTFINLGKTVMEWFVLDRYTPEGIRHLVDVHGLNHLQQALAQGHGVIALSGHFGNWELLPMALTSLGFQGGVLARDLRYPEYRDFVWSMRSRKHVATYERGSLKEVSRLLRANQIIGMMPDQDTDSLESVFVEFFDKPAYTPVGPAALSLMTGAPIVPCFVVRAGRKFRVVIEEPLTVIRTDERTQDLIDLTQRWSQVVESYVRRYPDHWAWMHRRWKTKPPAADSAHRPVNLRTEPRLAGTVA